jgi:anti-sigma-K factor RskA
MSGPDFRDLVGDEETPEDLAKLRRAHELLIAAGPPPELSPRLADPPRTHERFGWWHERRNQAAFGLAAAVAAAAFGVGYLVGDHGSSQYQAAGPPIPMHAVMDGSAAEASIVIGERDGVGNWPLLVHVNGLPPLPEKQWYELYLTRKGKPAAYCGSFSVNDSGRTTVQFSIPYRLKGFDGWIVTRSGHRANKPVLLTT